MKHTILIIAFIGLCIAEDPDLKKRGVQKTPSPLNTVPSNGHQKPEPPNQQQQQQQPQPVYYHQPEVHPTQAYQYIPQHHIPFYPQQVLAPKYQLFATKTANGHTQLTLVPQGLVMAHYTPQYVPVQPHQHHVQTTVTPQTVPPNNYVTPQPQVPYYYNSLIAQPSTMFIYTQPASQLYQNYATPSIYSQAIQQLLHYYHHNPQARYQLIYGNHPANNYQAPLSGTEYEKVVPVSQNLASSQKPDVDNNNDYLTPPEVPFRAAPPFPSRSPVNYKN